VSPNSYNLEDVDGVDAEPGEIDRSIRHVVESDLPRELGEIYGLKVSARFITTRPGSIVAFFAATVAAVGVFSSYSDFFESVALVRKHSTTLLKRMLESRFAHGMEANVSVSTEYPHVVDPDDLHPRRWLRRHFGPDMFPAALLGTKERSSRDGFFWFLLAWSILATAALAVLVAGAVVRTYFP